MSEFKIVNERVVSYINSLSKNNEDICDKIEEYARRTKVPIIRKEIEPFLTSLLIMKNAKNILEIGTAIGYSSIFMSFAKDDIKITTIELDEARYNLAKENVKKANKEDVINLLLGDANEIIKDLNEEYDFIFLDAAKGQYINIFEDVLRLCKKDGVIVTDNVLQDGDILEAKFLIEKRDRTIHKRMRDFLYAITHDDRIHTSIIPIGDGIAITNKNH